MTSVRLDIEYDGSGFSGWARQPGLLTVQGALEEALAKIFRSPATLTVAGRTDAGVHALGQVASFETDEALPKGLAHRLNGTSPDHVTVRSATVAEEGFDARGDATSRSYRYRLLARAASSPFEDGRALWWPYRLDRDALDQCAALVRGSHDFTAFTPTQTDHVHFQRTVFTADWEWDGDSGAFLITADAFMRNMVRVLVGTQLDVATGRRSIDDLSRLLEGAPRSEAGETAPPHGLYLESVSYS